MSNRLAEETSPYLLQHKDNPVAWQPWGPGALAEAQEREVPILLSVGYAACHWCHVMERESFEDEKTAAYMNEHFVPVKVDREERPDIDSIYMEAVQSITGQGGWPLTAFLDPQGVPFHGGTYFPPDTSRGMPSFMMVMEAVIKAWDEKRDEILAQSGDVRSRLGAVSLIGAPEGDLDPELPKRRAANLAEQADMDLGGFGPAPKFPSASALDFMLGQGETAAAGVTLDRMAAGGIFDQLAGGFARYSVDDRWLVPHFEKMLYDNALLARTYLRAWQTTGRDRYRWVAQKTLDWAMAEMLDPAGGFYASLDADSEGHEGLFYTWTPAEIEEALGQDAGEAIEAFGVTAEGHLEGRSVLHLPGGAPPDEIDPGLEELTDRLLAARSARIRPDLDDKVLSSWNSLMISALSEAGAVLGRTDYLEAAQRCADFIWNGMRSPQGNLLRTWRQGEARLNAYLEDHAFLLEALLDLYQACFDPVVFDRARAVAETMIDRFSDPARGGFFTTSHDHEELIARRKDVGDHPIPASSSSAALGLLRLAAMTGESAYRRKAEEVLKLLAPATSRQPAAFGHLLQALAFYHSGGAELAIAWPADADAEADRPGCAVPAAAEPLVAEARRRYRPNLVIAGGPDGSSTPPLMQDRTSLEGQPAAYVCQSFTCQAPVNDPAELGKELDALDQ
ncbi:MAG TPA: thioredoxin domain-containing protein [Solirubrobacterales bacterium]|nr:thioredoxin domain-containing protein [Solirubrobacterales bacterium]